MACSEIRTMELPIPKTMRSKMNKQRSLYLLCRCSFSRTFASHKRYIKALKDDNIDAIRDRSEEINRPPKPKLKFGALACAAFEHVPAKSQTCSLKMKRKFPTTMCFELKLLPHDFELVVLHYWKC